MKTGGSFSKDMLKLVSGFSIVQLLNLLAAPLLTRLYSPESFGAVALFISITSIISAIACMRYELAIVLPEDDEEAANIFVLSLVISVMITIVTAVVVILGRNIILDLLDITILSPYLYLIPIAVQLTGISMALSYWSSRKKRFGTLSVSKVGGSLAMTAVALGGGVAGIATHGTMIGSNLAGQLVSMIILGMKSWRDDWRYAVATVRWRAISAGMKRHRNFPLYSSWSALLNVLSWQLPVFLLSMFFSPTVVGYYSFGFRILQLPMNLIGSAISQVFFQRAAEARHDGKLAVLVEDLFRRLVMFGLFPMLMLTIAGRDLYRLVFGENWSEAGVYTQILGLWAFLWFISSPLSTLFAVLEKQDFGFKLNIVLLATRLLSLVLGGFLGNARLSLILFSLTGILIYGYLCYAIMAHAGVARKAVVTVILDGLKPILPFLVVQLVVQLVSQDIWQKNISVGILSVLYLAYLYKKQVKGSG
ncbi:MAG: oligosaccharide flippase family protein [Thermodesulfobacteriota bacterium]